MRNTKSTDLAKKSPDFERTVNTAVKLSLVELSLGTLAHGLHIPFTGNLLSLNQGAFLCTHLRPEDSRWTAFISSVEISAVASLMKSLSIAGKRLGPMISIAIQGALFGFGTFLFGSGLLGQSVGMVFLSLWAFIQSFLTYYLIFGFQFIDSIAFYSQKLAQFGIKKEHLFIAFGAFLSFKILVALTLPFVLKFLPASLRLKADTYFDKLEKNLRKERRTQGPQVWKGVIKDLIKPFFLVSMLLMFIFFLMVKENIAMALMSMTRPLAVAILIFYLTRAKWLKTLLMSLASQTKWSKRIASIATEGQARIHKEK